MNHSTKLVSFLQDDLGVGAEAMAIALKTANSNLGPVHIILWQLGLISSAQLVQVLDWLEGYLTP